MLHHHPGHTGNDPVSEWEVCVRIKLTKPIPKSDWALDIIRLLLRLREPKFSFEREIRLYELQTWV
jgi:hypothetical protein